MVLTDLRKIALDLITHFVLTVIFSLFIYFKSEDLFYVVIFIVGGIFIDLDHLIDHFLFFKNRFKLIDFLNRRFLESGKVYLFLHSWEVIGFILSLSLVIKSSGLLVFSLGLILHLIVDNLQRERRLFYFLAYRIIKRFDAEFLLPEHNPYL